MADDDEIDILGDFSFNSCFAQNNQGIPSCSNREDTVHPQWLLDSPPTNWYDTQNKDKSYRPKDGPSRKLSGTTANYQHTTVHTSWTQKERDLLAQEMARYGRNVNKISKALKTKSELEIQALIEAEHGILLETENIKTPAVKPDNIPTVAQEEKVSNCGNVDLVVNNNTEECETAPVPRKCSKMKKSHKNIKEIDMTIETNPMIGSEIFYDDDLIIGSTESIGSELDVTDVVATSLTKQQRDKTKVLRKNGNHRRKVSRNFDRNRSKDFLKSPHRRKKDSSLSDDSVKSPKMQIVLGSGLALPVSEGEEVIKIEKKPDLDGESDIEVDVGSDSDKDIYIPKNKTVKEVVHEEVPVAVPLRKFEPMPRRNRKINLDGGGGYTIMHTEAGDMYEIGQEPRKERQQRKQAVQLIPLHVYNSEKPAPCAVHMFVSVLVSMDVQAHCSRAEVMGLTGGSWEPGPRTLTLQLYRTVRAAAAHTHCDMDPVSQSSSAESLRCRGVSVCGWHHSHPQFPPSPSVRDLVSQRSLQSLAWGLPCVALVTSQHWPPGRRASQLRCFRVEEDDKHATPEVPAGYQLNVKLERDLDRSTLDQYLEELRVLAHDTLAHVELPVDVTRDVCPQAGITYMEKCLSSVSHHMRSAGYEDEDPIVARLLQGIRDIFR
ncbi:uncharacterized protein LOC116774167 isoform X1 [Danaus plexippus]|uniref:uncharacterized protein LOC116774167 isoform X1 n=1 Tax=Danaus plexippus TaxID=13037 RepID=UPI002AB18067|nr:uncharacterized protein LOC116774167 isoform X1 [Danaus plexippus]